MKAHSLPAGAGWRWLTEAYAIFRKRPAQLLFVVSMYWIVILLLNLIPLLGAIASAVAIPALSVGVMNACRDLDEGRMPLPNTLFAALRGSHRNTLLILGVLYLVLTIAILLSGSLIDGGDFSRYLMTGKRPAETALESGAPLFAALLIMSLLVPLMMAFWFGPMLAAWYRLPAIKALFFSLVACALNWRPFLVYGLALLVAIVVPFFLLGVVAQLLPQAAGVVGFVISLPMLLVLMPVVFASFYVSFRDVFGVSELV